MSNKIFKVGGQSKSYNVPVEIPMNENVGKILDFCVQVEELFVIGNDNKLYAYGEYKSFKGDHSFTTNYLVMTELDISKQKSAVIGGSIQVVPRYNGAYLIVSKPSHNLDLYRVLKKRGFIDLVIIH